MKEKAQASVGKAAVQDYAGKSRRRASKFQTPAAEERPLRVHGLAMAGPDAQDGTQAKLAPGQRPAPLPGEVRLPAALGARSARTWL